MTTLNPKMSQALSLILFSVFMLIFMILCLGIYRDGSIV